MSITCFLMNSPQEILREVAINTIDDEGKKQYSLIDDNYKKLLAKVNKLSSVIFVLASILTLSSLVICPSLYAFGAISKSATIFMMCSKIFATTMLVLLNKFIEHKKNQVNHFYAENFSTISGPKTWLFAYINGMKPWEYKLFSASKA